MITCGEGMKKRYRKCLNPPTINNALGCEGFPMQVQACFVECQPTSAWSEWSEWQVECDGDDNCRKVRKRFCVSNEASKCEGESVETINCSTKNLCFRPSRLPTKQVDVDSVFAGLYFSRDYIPDQSTELFELIDSTSTKYLLPIILAITVLLLLLVSLVLFICIRHRACKNFSKFLYTMKPQANSTNTDLAYFR
jgi:hypothetical protein